MTERENEENETVFEFPARDKIQTFPNFASPLAKIGFAKIYCSINANDLAIGDRLFFRRKEKKNKNTK